MDDSSFTKAAPAQPPEVRIGDSERQGAADQLQKHFAAGRLTWEELDERLAAAWAARVNADLMKLFTDLPMLTPPMPPYAPARVRPNPRTGSSLVTRLRSLDIRILVVLGLAVAIAIGATDGLVIPIALFGWFFVSGRRAGHHHGRNPYGHHPYGPHGRRHG